MGDQIWTRPTRTTLAKVRWRTSPSTRMYMPPRGWHGQPPGTLGGLVERLEACAGAGHWRQLQVSIVVRAARVSACHRSLLQRWSRPPLGMPLPPPRRSACAVLLRSKQLLFSPVSLAPVQSVSPDPGQHLNASHAFLRPFDATPAVLSLRAHPAPRPRRVRVSGRGDLVLSNHKSINCKRPATRARTHRGYTVPMTASSGHPPSSSFLWVLGIRGGVRRHGSRRTSSKVLSPRAPNDQ
ncbi:hypothetical protein PYCCODRAFT_791107 [Trametes coccinea BRFM310]|uniref:Uncharacterized protein n=1 Tax=Trametes coccinea (strain BRFM310) TaxID=1353009 RepID=A0A1Y2J0X1_TRAC3|nr:hypothetical protein PYCCODRAFT_791107 [Trametes coccinea BRFM310]